MNLMASSKSRVTTGADRTDNANTSYLWKYVTVAANYVGLRNNNIKKQDGTKNARNTNLHNESISNYKSHALTHTDLYSEIGVECLNYLAKLLDSTRPRLNNQKVVTEKSLSLMQTNYVLLIEIFTFLPFENIIMIIEQINNDKNKQYNQLNLSCDYLLFNDISGDKYVRDRCLKGYSLQNRNIIWPYLIFHDFDRKQYHKLYEKYMSHVEYFHHPLIAKDIDRTLIINFDDDSVDRAYGDYYAYGHDVLNKSYKKKLKTILSIYCILDPEVGYIQGMNYIAANVLIALDGNVHNAFAVFCHLMKRDSSPPYYIDTNSQKNENIHHNAQQSQFQSHAYCAGGRISKTGAIGYGLRDLYLPSLPGLIICLLQFEKLIKLYLPKLYQYFVSQGIQVTNFASEWFLSLFSYILPLKLFLRIIDIFICDGWETLHRAGLSLLYLTKFSILKNKMSFDKILLLLKRKDLLQYLNINETVFIRLAMSFDVSNRYLHESAVELLTKSMARHNAPNYSTLIRKR